MATGRSNLGFIIILIAGTVLRGWLAATPDLGYHPDLKLFATWARLLHLLGLAGFYEQVSFCNYPPLTLLILWSLGFLPNEIVLQSLIKVPACLADLAIGILLYVEARRILGVSRGAAAFALYYLNPVSIYQSAYWGQVDSIHCAFLLMSLMMVHRSRWIWAGAAVGLALQQKLQSIALVPLIVFEIYRAGRWRALAKTMVGAAIVTLFVWIPFMASGTLPHVLRRGYLNAVGQYQDLSRNAFNLWYLIAEPGIPDTSVPPAIAHAVAEGRLDFPENASWMLRLTWRNIGLSLYVLCVAGVLSLYSLRPTIVNRFGAVGMLGLVFFLIPTEMHERYALPAITFLPIWAVASPWRERAFFLFSALLCLNLSTIFGADKLAPMIAGTNLILLIGLGTCLLYPALPPGRRGLEPLFLGSPDPADPDRTPLVRWFRRATVVAITLWLSVAAWVASKAWAAPPLAIEPDVIYLSDLVPAKATQGWGTLRSDRAVSGGLIQFGGSFYLRGLGMHAPAKVSYRLPDGFDALEAVVGIDHCVGGRGTVVVSVALDGPEVYRSPVLAGSSGPVSLQIPLKGVKNLELQAEPTEDGMHFDHVDWANARLVKAPLIRDLEVQKER